MTITYGPNNTSLQPSDFNAVRDSIKCNRAFIDELMERSRVGQPFSDDVEEIAMDLFRDGWNAAKKDSRLPDDLAQAICRVARDAGTTIPIELVHEMLARVK